MNEIDEISKMYLVKTNVLFVDPVRKMIKPQSKLDLLAIRELTRKNNSLLSDADERR